MQAKQNGGNRQLMASGLSRSHYLAHVAAAAAAAAVAPAVEPRNRDISARIYWLSGASSG